MLTLSLNWPPSVNHYWESSGKRRYIGKRGIQYIAEVKSRKMLLGDLAWFNGVQSIGVSLSVHIEAHPPDKRRRDLDNILKCCLDSIQKAGIIDDDYNIVDLHIVRRAVEKPGRLIVTIDRFNAPH